MFTRVRGRGSKLAFLGLLLTFLAPARTARAQDVVLQGFYWDSPEDWWRRMTQEVPEFADVGFGWFWAPPMSKGAAGRYSMGYDPFDPYDLGEHDQMGTIPT